MMGTQEARRLTVKFYQLAGDELFRSFRTDGSGWDWGWADIQRDWMNATPSRHAYRCLPLTIVNQTGWWVKNPVGFTATWDGSPEPGSICFDFAGADPVWTHWINSQFGEGIITWNTPFLIRTEPAGSRLLITGPANYFRPNAHPLTALIESDWMTMSFTMNYKVMTPREPVRFEVGEPLFQVIPLANNICADLENAEVRYQRLVEDPALLATYLDWATSRAKFHEAKARREVRGDGWQKDYFQGKDASGRVTAPEHKTKLTPPQILYGPAGAGPAARGAVGVGHSTGSALDQRAEQPHALPPPPRRRPGPRRLARIDTAQRCVPPGTGRSEVAPSRAVGTDQPIGFAACPMGFGRAVGHSGGTAQASSAGTDPGRPVRGEQEVPMKRLAKAPRRMSRSLSLPTGSVHPMGQVRRVDPIAPRVPVDDNHRRWIAENLLLDCPPEMVHEAMIAAGVDREVAAAEIHLALQSPYLLGADRLRNRLKKRDWLLTAYRKVNRLHPESHGIPRKHRPSRDQFLAEHYSTNRPVIITGMMDNWPALRKWNLDFFAQNFGDREIEVQFGRNSGANYEVEREKYLKKVGFGEFVEMVRTGGRTNDFYLTANNNSSNKQILPELWNDIIQIPEYLDGSDPMNGFFWMGPSGTVTPFHHDLTNNFMAQVLGRKKVKIAPSWDLPLMRNDRHVFSAVDGIGLPEQVTPPVGQPQIIECVLEPGELLFLPIGCLHFVEGLDISVTVSFTNFRFDNDFSSFYSTYHAV